MDSRSITRNARHRGAALHPDQSNEPAHLRTPALLCPFSCSSPALHPHPAEDFLSQAQIYFSLPFVSTLKHAFNKMLEILTAKAVSKVCWFCLHKIRRTALPTQPHAAAPAQGLLISTQLQHILDLDRGILPCWYSPRKLRRKVLLLASTSITASLPNQLLGFRFRALPILSWPQPPNPDRKSWVPPSSKLLTPFTNEANQAASGLSPIASPSRKHPENSSPPYAKTLSRMLGGIYKNLQPPATSGFRWWGQQTWLPTQHTLRCPRTVQTTWVLLFHSGTSKATYEQFVAIQSFPCRDSRVISRPKPLHYWNILLDVNDNTRGLRSTPSLPVHPSHSQPTSSPLSEVHLLHAHTGTGIWRAPSQQLA